MRFVLPIVALAALALQAAAQLPPLIPKTVLFGNPVKASPQISPDGTRLAYIAPDSKDVLQVWVQTVGKDDAKAVTADPKRGIRQYLWTYAPDTLVYLQDAEGDENFHVYGVNVATAKVRDLTPFPGVRAQLVGDHRDFPNELLVGLNKRNKALFDVYRIDLTSGEAKLDTENPGDVIGWETDAQFQVRGAQAPTPEGGMQIRVRDDAKSPWQPVTTFGVEDADSGVLGFTKDGKSLWMRSSQGRDTLALTRFDIASKTETVVAADPTCDVAGVLIDPITYTADAVAFNRERVRWQVLQPQWASDFKFLETAGKGEPSFVNFTRDEKTAVVAFTSDVRSTAYYLFDRAGKKLTFLFESQPAFDKYTLAPMKPVVIKARDGLDLVSYLTLPVGVSAKNLPLVLMVHGGPWARDTWGLNPQAQWLANRGYAVLSVNYRGSTGFGKKFLHAGDKEWAGKMHDDLLDAMAWAVKEGYADAKRVGIYGGSYGGYAALVGATFTPDVFACAVDVVGPSNLVTLLKSIPPYWGPMKKTFSVRVGDLETEEQLLKDRSPLFKVDRIKIPLLIGQGANDPRVKQAESEQIVEAMKKANKPVEYVLFADEGHGFARPENRLKFFGVMEQFLAKHLGGRSE
ncbi:MAG: S9 family peptidase [Gemmataceae bacterium]